MAKGIESLRSANEDELLLMFRHLEDRNQLINIIQYASEQLKRLSLRSS
jgi:hypothetical protein